MNVSLKNLFVPSDKCTWGGCVRERGGGEAFYHFYATCLLRAFIAESFLIIILCVFCCIIYYK